MIVHLDKSGLLYVAESGHAPKNGLRNEHELHDHGTLHQNIREN